MAKRSSNGMHFSTVVSVLLVFTALMTWVMDMQRACVLVGLIAFHLMRPAARSAAIGASGNADAPRQQAEVLATLFSPVCGLMVSAIALWFFAWTQATRAAEVSAVFAAYYMYELVPMRQHEGFHLLGIVLNGYASRVRLAVCVALELAYIAFVSYSVGWKVIIIVSLYILLFDAWPMIKEQRKSDRFKMMRTALAQMLNCKDEMNVMAKTYRDQFYRLRRYNRDELKDLPFFKEEPFCTSLTTRMRFESGWRNTDADATTYEHAFDDGLIVGVQDLLVKIPATERWSLTEECQTEVAELLKEFRFSVCKDTDSSDLQTEAPFPPRAKWLGIAAYSVLLGSLTILTAVLVPEIRSFLR